MKPLHVIFLWHQHQPLYKDLVENKILLPWVRLHALKDYLSMAEILSEFPKMKAAVNLTPCLLSQIEDDANGMTDPYLTLARKPSEALGEAEACLSLRFFFMANFQTQIQPYPRYLELYIKRGRNPGDEDLRRILRQFSVQDLRDVCVWFHIVWSDPYGLRVNRIQSLMEKGRGFSEEEKQELLDILQKRLSRIIPRHKELQDKGQMELTTTPFYHPILPLLVDSETAKISNPNLSPPIFQHPQDAKAQLEMAAAQHERLFGKKPAGLWPSEGSVSENILPLVQETGFSWLATDEEILWRSLSENKERSALYQPYQIGNLSLFFRNHELSDLIGFSYARVSPREAVEDFLGRLRNIQRETEGTPAPAVVSVILDGENCWEYYPQEGREFLRRLYQGITSEPDLIPTTPSEVLSLCPPKERLSKLWPGSWINANFNIWIGHAEDHLAWEHLSRAREFLVSKSASPSLTANPQSLKMAWDSLYAAEGSDWCWWFGPEHQNFQEGEFDALFRKHLQNVYLALGEKPPEALRTAIRKQRAHTGIFYPTNFMRPKIDGLITSYFEWMGAGGFEAKGSAMHASETLLPGFAFGFDCDNLYLRLDAVPSQSSGTKGTPEGRDVPERERLFRILFLSPATEVEISIEESEARAILKLPEGKTQPLCCAAKKVIEVEISFEALGVSIGERIEFCVSVIEDGIEKERWPRETNIALARPGKDFESHLWSA